MKIRCVRLGLLEGEQTEIPMERIIQVTTTWVKGPKTVDVNRYTDGEMNEVFATHELLWLSQGKIVERGNCEFVDLQAWFKRTTA